MKTKLSINLNKIALLRNSRDTTIPSVVWAAETAIAAGAEGITVHPRPDQRHIRPQDVYDLAELLSQSQYQEIEFNIEGNPFADPEDNGYPGFMQLVTDTKPHQATLVPDDPIQLTSDHGWSLDPLPEGLAEIIDSLKQQGIRSSLFMDPINDEIQRVKDLGADRIEFYTGPYADTYPEHQAVLAEFIKSGEFAHGLGIGINAGHDLNLDNLATFCREVPAVAEVSIGHAVIKDALEMGLSTAVSKYRTILDGLLD